MQLYGAGSCVVPLSRHVICVSDGNAGHRTLPGPVGFADVLFKSGRLTVGSVIKKRRKRMAKKKHRKLLKKTRVQRRKLGK